MIDKHNKNPRVSVKIITYNHEPFIARAIEGVLMQECNFDYEVIIGEDCSTDNTRNIVVSYRDKNPDKIRLFLPEINVGSRENYRQTLNMCRGQYIAVLDGDDYWTSKNKLQKQADFLDAHNELSSCFHNVTAVYVGREGHFLYPNKKIKPFLSLQDLLYENFMPTSSVMYRNNLFSDFPKEFNVIPFGDWPRHILNAIHGNVGYINEDMAVHILHKGGVWSNTSEDPVDNQIKKDEANIIFYNVIDKYLDYKYRKIIAGCIRKCKNRIMRSRLKKKIPSIFKIYHKLRYHFLT